MAPAWGARRWAAAVAAWVSCVGAAASHADAAQKARRFLQGAAAAANATEQLDSASCKAHDRCRHLVGDCCPAPDGQRLACCEAPPPACGPHPGCHGLSGDCCPAPDGMYLACCGAPPARDTEYGVPLDMTPSCDQANVGGPNCGASARCEGEHIADGSARILRATSDKCAYVTFKTDVSLKNLLQLDADIFIKAGTCRAYDNLAFWFFQTTEQGDPTEKPEQHWDALSEVDLMETYIGPGAINSVNTNFAAYGVPKQWRNTTIEGGAHQHVTLWQDTDNLAGCPLTRETGVVDFQPMAYGKALPVVSIFVAHCAPGAPCCQGSACRQLQRDPDTASACVTVKEAPVLFALSNWGAGHRVTPGCELGVSNVRVVTH